MKRRRGEPRPHATSVARADLEAQTVQVFDVVRKVRDRYVNTSQPPTATAVAVVQLAQKDYLIEVEAVAVVS
ncbi:MAG: RidA family protein [Burkholderiaceae bacterium]